MPAPAVLPSTPGARQEAATAHLRASLRGRAPVPVDPSGRYLLVWSEQPGRRSQMVLEAGDAAEAAAFFAFGFGWQRPALLEAAAGALFVTSGRDAGAFPFMVLPASSAAAKAVSAVLRRATNHTPQTCEDFIARASSPFATARPCVVARVPAAGGHASEHVRVTGALGDATAEQAAQLLTADLRIIGSAAMRTEGAA